MKVTGASEIAARLVRQEVAAAENGFKAVIKSVESAKNDLGRGGFMPPHTPMPLGTDALAGFRTQAVSALEHLENLSVVKGFNPSSTLVSASDEAIAAGRRGVTLIDDVSPSTVESADLEPIVAEFTAAQKKTGEWLNEVAAREGIAKVLGSGEGTVTHHGGWTNVHWRATPPVAHG